MPQPITYPFLLCATNSHEAVWLSITGDNNYQEIYGAVDPKYRYTDNESRFRSISSDVNHEWEYETAEHLKRIAQKTRELWESQVYTRLVVAAPEELKNRVHEALHVQLPSTAYTSVAGNFVHRSLHAKLLEEAHQMLRAQ